MINVLISFIILCVIVGILYLIGNAIITAMGLPAVAHTLLYVLCLVAFLIWVLMLVQGGGTMVGPWPRVR